MRSKPNTGFSYLLNPTPIISLDYQASNYIVLTQVQIWNNIEFTLQEIYDIHKFYSNTENLKVIIDGNYF